MKTLLAASRPGAAYLTLLSEIDDRLLSVSSPVTGHVMIHTTEMDANAVARMIHLETLKLTAGETVGFAPGNMHLMPMDLADKLDEGGQFPLMLTFARAGPITVNVPVLGVEATGPEATQ